MRRHSFAMLATIFLSLVPSSAFALVQPINLDCTALRGLARSHCERTVDAPRTSSRQSRPYGREQQTVIERRLLRRNLTESGLRGGKAQATRRAEGIEALRERRQSALRTAGERLQKSRDRLQAIREERERLLGARIGTLPRRRVLAKDQLRNIAKDLEQEFQHNRNALRRIREACAGMGIQERQQCMEEKRDSMR
jgi:hypothetical protein